MQTAFVRNVTGDVQPEVLSQIRNLRGFVSVVPFREIDGSAKVYLFVKLEDDALHKLSDLLTTRFPALTMQEGTTL